MLIGQAQESKDAKDDNQNQEKVHVKVKDKSNADVYIDGKKYDSEILELLDPDKIESMEVIKNEQALKEYSAPNGVILITTKKKSEADAQSNNSTIKIRGTGDSQETPLVIIDGEVVNKEAIAKMSPDDIDNIQVIKGENAMKKYNSKSGVIIVTSKKGKKKAKSSK